jgi:hypothetical protein
MASNRSERMGNRQGLAGFVDSLRYHDFAADSACSCCWSAPGSPCGRENRILAGS